MFQNATYGSLGRQTVSELSCRGHWVHSGHGLYNSPAQYLANKIIDYDRSFKHVGDVQIQIIMRLHISSPGLSSYRSKVCMDPVGKPSSR